MYDAEHQTPALERPVIGFTVDTRTVEGRQWMLDMFRANRRLDALRFPLGRVNSALISHRKTQANAALGVKGYFATVAESRAFVRESIALARKAAADFDAVPVRRAVA